MNEEAVRALVRELIARHLPSVAPSPQGLPARPASGLTAVHRCASAPGALPLAWHSSHSRYAVSSGEDVEGPCLIEPAVRCNHCGYCQSHGH